jgi:formate-dependent nitrite reductase membrane component NrfD
MRKLSRKTSIVAIIVVILLVLAVLLARTRPWRHRLALQSYVQHTSVPHICRS